MNHKTLATQIKKQSKLKDMITPQYDGLNLVNITSSVLKHFKAPALNPQLPSTVFSKSLFKGVKHVVMMVVDGLGYHQVLESTKQNKKLGLKKIIEKDTFIPLTSTCPSTTATALTTLNTSLTPSQHGITGYILFLKEFGAISNMLSFKALSSSSDYESLGVEPRDFFPLPTVAQLLRTKKVNPYTVMPSDIADSALSQMTHYGSETKPYLSTADMIIKTKNIIKQKKKSFSYVYTSHIDTLSHAYSKKSEEHEAQIANLDFSLMHDLINTRSTKDTLLLITADHGFISVDPKKAIHLLEHPALINNLVMLPTGEPRFTSLHVKNGKFEEVKKYCQDHFSKKALILESNKAIQLGLFGPPPIIQDTKDRLGDLLLIPKKNYTFNSKPTPSSMLGKHGGLSEEEMLVPLIAKRLG